MKLMNKSLWGIVKGTKPTMRDLTKLLEWKIRDNKAKSIIFLALADS
jgi:hypothetical protein